VSDGSPVPVRVVSDVATIKALSDPLRLAILRVLMEGSAARTKILSVKELADELGEPQTKLYRHIKQLHAQHLIEVAETRVVSGITEYRYRAGQLSLDIDPTIFGGSHLDADEAAEAFAAVIDRYRDDFLASIRAGLVQFAADPPYRKELSAMVAATMTPAKATEFRERLAALVDEISLTSLEPAADGVPIRLLAVFYSPS